MTYPEDVLKAARKIAEQVCLDKMMDAQRRGKISERDHFKALALRIRSAMNDPVSVEAAARAIMAERQRCAERADKQNWPSAKRTKTGDVRSFLQGYCAACDDIKAAIIGQQETGNDRA